jgi:hypothetical protein
VRKGVAENKLSFNNIEKEVDVKETIDITKIFVLLLKAVASYFLSITVQKILSLEMPDPVLDFFIRIATLAVILAVLLNIKKA